MINDLDFDDTMCTWSENSADVICALYAQYDSKVSSTNNEPLYTIGEEKQSDHVFMTKTFISAICKCHHKIHRREENCTHCLD